MGLQRRINLMRVAFMLLLLGNGIFIFTSIISSLHSINEYLGDQSIDWVTSILTFSNTLSLVSMVMSIAGSVFLLLALARIGEKGSFKLQSTSKIAFLLLIASLVLNFAFTYLLSSLEVWGALDSEGINTLLSYTPLLTVAVDSAFYIFLGFTLRTLKSDYKLSNKPLITTFLYPISFALRLLLMFDLFSSEITALLASLIVSVVGFVILIIFFSSGLIGLKKVRNRIGGVKFSEVLPSRRDGKFCANCGTSIESIASFCANCGHPIE